MWAVVSQARGGPPEKKKLKIKLNLTGRFNTSHYCGFRLVTSISLYYYLLSISSVVTLRNLLNHLNGGGVGDGQTRCDFVSRALK